MWRRQLILLRLDGFHMVYEQKYNFFDKSIIITSCRNVRVVKTGLIYLWTI